MSSEIRRWVALVVVCFGQLMTMVDASIVNVALPYVQRDLGMSQAELTWVVNAYLIAFGGFLLLAGRIGDLIGRRAVFLAGVFLFTVASVGTGFANGADHLIVGRFLQGMGASLMTGVIIAIIVSEFQKPAERAQAMSVFTLVLAGGGTLGLLLGGVITQFVNWHWIFFINLPIGVLTLAFGAWLIRENEGLGLEHGVDVLGALLVTAAVMLGVYAIVTAADYGWTSPHTVEFGGGALALVALFVLVERRVANPILPTHVLGISSLTNASIARAFVFTGISTSWFIGVLYLQHVRNYSAFDIGLAFLPTTLTLGVLSAGITARIMARIGPRNLLLAGIPMIVASLALLSFADDNAAYFPLLLGAFVLLGLGGGTTFLPLLTISMSEVPPAHAGVASGFSNATMQVGGALGLAVLGTLTTNHATFLIAQGMAMRPALASGYSLGYQLAAGTVAVALVVVVTMLRSRPAMRVVADVSDRKQVEAA
jgi:EmrB/QacA subfamily drug resistance transporter